MLIGISCGLIEARRDAKYCVSAFRHGGGRRRKILRLYTHTCVRLP